ncbi:hypothetical protein [Hydrogenibacillus sp. N12]|uniref:hypothetical protein n=1 Tax=Hydrogenibacillus sp. N12 TaxID=2866627 RepID=UPI001C7DC7BC|nr:hypothetical protein [Hydrogenibacillus sp. N12]QZA32257.1 hypothetical protein K2M58_07935 [Hydrogenibacillus sp. N12]
MKAPIRWLGGVIAVAATTALFVAVQNAPSFRTAEHAPPPPINGPSGAPVAGAPAPLSFPEPAALVAGGENLLPGEAPGGSEAVVGSAVWRPEETDRSTGEDEREGEEKDHEKDRADADEKHESEKRDRASSEKVASEKDAKERKKEADDQERPDEFSREAKPHD